MNTPSYRKLGHVKCLDHQFHASSKKADLESNVLAVLDSVSLITMRWVCNSFTLIYRCELERIDRPTSCLGFKKALRA
ncbi:hypothetical protein PAXRUDRAFT_835408 [Paxillus rubicundulus Ve08.2h10]|uniref:Uncharacterized protein n=1 Tax=Paxillus rubicundulus Ve08.2h10 TaxID=930991 RepID=A0A0D0CLX1_9AGAM|nr:hypothetical protein PAXRUDRAFT_835408 [Paxillus rubicundulus Ve08.2h10]